MARIRVIDNATGQRGTIDESKFDPRKYTQISAGQSAAYSVANAAPAVVGTTAGLLGGIPAVATTGPAGIGIGALAGGAGYAGGQAVKDLILELAGLRNKTPQQAGDLAEEVIKGTGGAAVTGAASTALLKALPFLFSPLKSFGKAREAAASKIDIPQQSVKEALEAAQSTLKTTPVQEAGKSLSRDWLDEMFKLTQSGPGKTLQSPKNIKGDDFYKILNELEKTAKSYTTATGTSYPTTEAATRLATSLRGLPGQQSRTVAGLNKILSALYRIQPFAKKAGYGAAGAAAAGGVTYPILRSLGVGGQK